MGGGADEGVPLVRAASGPPGPSAQVAWGQGNAVVVKWKGVGGDAGAPAALRASEWPAVGGTLGAVAATPSVGVDSVRGWAHGPGPGPRTGYVARAGAGCDTGQVPESRLGASFVHGKMPPSAPLPPEPVDPQQDTSTPLQEDWQRAHAGQPRQWQTPPYGTGGGMGRGSLLRDDSMSQGAASRKTRLCCRFMENGRCKYGDACGFAHGEAELRVKPLRSMYLYKTKLCRWFEEGFCPMGSKCSFSHGMDELRRRDPNAPTTAADTEEAEQLAAAAASAAHVVHRAAIDSGAPHAAGLSGPLQKDLGRLLAATAHALGMQGPLGEKQLVAHLRSANLDDAYSAVLLRKGAFITSLSTLLSQYPDVFAVHRVVDEDDWLITLSSRITHRGGGGSGGNGGARDHGKRNGQARASTSAIAAPGGGGGRPPVFPSPGVSQRTSPGLHMFSSADYLPLGAAAAPAYHRGVGAIAAEAAVDRAQERFVASSQAAPFYGVGTRRSELTAMMQGLMNGFVDTPNIVQKGSIEQLGGLQRGSGSPWAHPGGRFGGSYAMDTHIGQLGRSPRDPWGLPTSSSNLSAPASSAGSVAGQLPSDDELLGTSPAT